MRSIKPAQLKEGLHYTALLLQDAIFPPRCAACLDFCEPGFCAGCSKALQPIVAPLCRCCGIPFPTASLADICARCRRNRYHPAPAYDLVRSVYAFTGPMRPAIHRFKYGGATALADSLARLCADYLKAAEGQADDRNCAIPIGDIDFVVPVPLHAFRSWRRGYNQSELLARSLVKQLAESKACYAQPLRRLRYTQPQVELDRRHRHDNMHGAFALEPRCPQHDRLRGASILLMDDVCTTTSTLAECARVLRTARPQAIYAITIARQL